jgi:hypothetical protein
MTVAMLKRVGMKDESEEDAVYDAEMSEFLSNEKDLHMNPRSALSLCGTARIKVRAQFGLPEAPEGEVSTAECHREDHSYVGKNEGERL